jgi:hypothetical protein
LFSGRKSAASGLDVRSADLPKLAEALAKVIDAFTHAGPTISALIASFVFMGLAAWIALHTCVNVTSNNISLAPAQSTPMTTKCIITGLPEPTIQNEEPFSFTDLFTSFDKESNQEPKGCLNAILDRTNQAAPDLIFLVGRSDRRLLRKPALRVYRDNLALGYRRAVSLRKYLVDRYQTALAQKPPLATSAMFASRIIPLAAGPEYLGSTFDSVRFSADRCVEIVAYWSARK